MSNRKFRPIPGAQPAPNLGAPPWAVEEALAFLDEFGHPALLPEADRAIYIKVRDALVREFKPSGVTETLLIRDLSHNELQIWRYDAWAERLRRHHEVAALERLIESFYPADPGIMGKQLPSGRLRRTEMGGGARHNPEGLRTVGDMLADAHLDARDVDAAAFEENLALQKQIMGLRVGCEERRRRLMQDIAEWRRGGYASPPEVMARCARALRDILKAYQLK